MEIKKFINSLKVLISVSMLLVLITACTKQNEEQLPVDFVWDRAICDQCRMAISDNRYGAQVINSDGKAYLFDDIGCAVSWLQKQEGMDKARIWVNDKETRQWIEASKANWIFGDEHTPMGYGFAATKASVHNPMDFVMVQKKIITGDTLVNLHKKRHLGKNSKGTMSHAQPSMDHSKMKY